MPQLRPPVVRSVNNAIERLNQAAQKSEEEARINHGSRQFQGAPKFTKGAEDYGRPVVGTKSQARGVRAGDAVMREVIFLCEIIQRHAQGVPPNCTIKFGPLFVIYSYYSQSLVGMLIRARKYGLVEFEGEMLYQRQDDHKEIRLLKSLEEIRQIVVYSGDPGNCVKIKEEEKGQQKSIKNIQAPQGKRFSSC